MAAKVRLGLVKTMLCLKMCKVVLEDTCLNQDRYNNNEECEVLTRLVLKYGPPR